MLLITKVDDVESNRSTLIKIAYMYYEEGRTQRQISEHLNCSRMQVSRYLQRAREEGIVRISIDYGGTFPDMERMMREKFDLKEVVIVPYDKTSLLKRTLAQAAASLLLKRMRLGCVIGVGWGSTLALIPEFLADVPAIDVTFVPLLGGFGRIDIHMHANQIASRLGEIFGGKSLILNSPALVNDVELKTRLMADLEIKSTLDAARKSDIALVGIGAPFGEGSTLSASGYYSAEDIENLRMSGAECNVLSTIYLNEKGEECNFDLAERNVGVSSDEYRNIPLKIAVAGGRGKFYAICSAIEHKLVDIIVTDQESAEFCLEQRSSCQITA
jgi:DNA-binding transcriptional regulator LsrR (DeoR family)